MVLTQCICNEGYTGPDGAQCEACAAGGFKDVNGSAACTVCMRGMYSTATAAISEATCQDCPASTYSGAGSGLLTNCTCNKGYTGPDGLECAACIAGTYKDVNGSAPCSPCSQGKYSTETGEISESTCSQCPAYTYSAHGSGMLTNCTCNKGYTGPDGIQCAACIAGTYKDVNGSALCVACQEGKYSTAWGAIRDATCQCCPAHSHSPSGSGRQTNCTCNAGFEGPNGQPCEGCEEGKYKSVNGTVPCALCPARSHTMGLVAQPTCTCFPETYASSTEPLVCHRCPRGAYCWEDATCALVRSPPTCAERQVLGNWSAENTTRNDTAGRIVLASCPAGYSLLFGQGSLQHVRQECVPGVWVMGPAWACPYGHGVSNLSAKSTGREPFKECVECPARTECVSPPCRSCSACAAGFYKNSAGTHPCSECPTLIHREGIHIPGCGCQPGFYGSYGNCSFCEPNHYCPGGGHMFACPTGLFVTCNKLTYNVTNVTNVITQPIFIRWT